MTKVLRKIGIAAQALLYLGLGFAQCDAEDISPAADHPAADLYSRLESVGLDSSRVYRVRDCTIDRAAVHISLNDGIIAFTRNVGGQVTGAFFEGDGEILISPPNQTERGTMMLFTGGAILEESFMSAYLRFNDVTFAQMQSSLALPTDPDSFISRWDTAARSLAGADALRLFVSALNQAPPSATEANGSSKSSIADSFLHARIRGRKLGTFDVYYDSQSPEQVRVGQLRNVENDSYFDTWSSFSVGPPAKSQDDLTSDTGDGSGADSIRIDKYKIEAEVSPPAGLKAEAWLTLRVQDNGQRTILFDLSRYLQVDHVEANGREVEFIHNSSAEGAHSAREGNDLIAVVFPDPIRSGQQIELHFKYHGDVLSDAGGGLLYVGARGTWYPNRGLAMASYDLDFKTPPGWTLVATGKRTVDPSTEAQSSRWVSDKPIPMAGFNLGRYSRVDATAGNVRVSVYATQGVEKSFPKASSQATLMPGGPGSTERPIVIQPASPSPRRAAQTVADSVAQAVDFFSHRFGPYPYSELSLAQMPGGLSQGWPSLVYLSSFSFLTDEERDALHMDPVQRVISNNIQIHETAHQWWGDAVTWAGYRDQWIMEALANYSALMFLQSKEPQQFRAVMAHYREDLLQNNSSGSPMMDDGAVTLGLRLSNSHFPNGYEAISYGRGTWLFHMLRYMMLDAEQADTHGARRRPTSATEEPFIRVLRKIRETYGGRALTTADLIHAFEREINPSLRYEGQKTLEWFSQSWLNGAAIPQLSVQGLKITPEAGLTLVTGKIRQKNCPSDMVTSVPVYAVVGKRNVFVARVFADGPETPFRLKAPAGTRRIVLDPEETVLATIE